MKLKELMEKYGEYEVNSKCVVGECEIERIVIDLTKPKPKSVWDLEKGDECWALDEIGTCIHKSYGDGCFDDERRRFGTIFLTEREALKEIDRREKENLLLENGGRRWFKDGEMNWRITYNHNLDEWSFLYSTRLQGQGAIYFDTKEQAQNAVKEIGKERLKKALFEVR